MIPKSLVTLDLSAPQLSTKLSIKVSDCYLCWVDPFKRYKYLYVRVEDSQERGVFNDIVWAELLGKVDSHLGDQFEAVWDAVVVGHVAHLFDNEG